MKFFLSLIILLSLQVRAHDLPINNGGGSISYATEDLLRRRGELNPPPDISDLAELNRVLFSEMKIQSEELKKAKYYLMNGEVRLAKVQLNRLAYTDTKLRPVINRFMAILSFVEGNFEKTHHYLSSPELQNIPHYSKICVLKVLSKIVLNKPHKLEEDWVRCQIENPGNFQERNLIWLETLVQLKINNHKGVTSIPFKRVRIASLDLEETKVMLKLALYLNQEQLVVNELTNLTIEQIQNTEIRELIGQIYFRTGSLAKSYRFVEDLKSPNSENIKGNLYLLRNKYELAYAQFKLALDQKINSQNAMERLLPLAWLLGDWEGGSKYSEQIAATSKTQVHKLTLHAAFLMQKGEYLKANTVLDAIAQRSRRGTEVDVTQLAGFTALMQNQPEIVRKQADMSCKQYDLINCWLQFQLEQWDAFPLTIRREDKIVEKRDWEKLTTSDLDEPLKETVFVNQLDIEEMDDKLIQLIKAP